jgi:glycosyltransferase involved in cell wall biosynthesis
MGTHKHFLLSSNRWYSAATEYALRVCEHLHGQGHIVRIYSHAESPILAKGKALGMETQVLALRKSNGRALGPFGLVSLVVSLYRLVSDRHVSTTGSTASKVYIWVLEGHEHALVSLLRTVFSSLRRNSVLVRLRMQDRFDGGGIFGALVARGTDHLVFPSEYARGRFFEGRSDLAAAYGDKVTVQYFCKDFAPELTSSGVSNAKPHDVFDLIGRNLNSFTFVAVARFDPVKGIALLIEAFAEFARIRICTGETGGRRLQLVIIGRSENIKVESLWQHAAGILGSQRREGSCYVAASPNADVSVILVDEIVSALPELLRRSDCAVISSLGSEVICRTAVEFLQIGLPIVSTAVGSLPETIGPELGESDTSGCGFYAAVDPPGRQHVVAELTSALARAYAAITAQQSESARNESSHKTLNERCRARGIEFGLAGFKPLVDRVKADGTSGIDAKSDR